MSKRHIPSSAINPCPICGNTSKKCRSKEDAGKVFYYCMSLADAKFGEVVNGLKCIHEASAEKSYFASVWVLDNSAEWTEEQRREWEAKREKQRQAEAQAEAAKQKRSLSAAERDRYYRSILDELTLHPDDRADLVRRGFTDEQIAKSGFKSVSREQFLKTAVSGLLPGASADGKRFYSSVEGYVCPVRDVNELICGLQVRARDAQDGGRYRWINTKNQTLHLYPEGNKELPLATFKTDSPAGTALAEGTGAKPFLVSQRLALNVIGAAGGAWLSSPTILRKALEKLSDDKTILVFPDAGDALNHHVMSRWRKLCNLLVEWGYRPAIQWWDQTTKEGTDVDELEDYSAVQTISPDEFFQIAEKAQKPSTQESSKENIRSQKAWDLWRKFRQFTGDIKLNSEFITDEVQTPESGTIAAIKSALGTGKTSWLYKLIKELDALGWVALGYRNGLLLQFCEEANFYHYQQDLKQQAELELLTADSTSKIACCIDSIIHFRPEDFEGKVIIMDEVQSTINQLLTANTAVAKWRTKAKELFVEALKRADRVILLDGNLCDDTINYLAKLAGNFKKIVKTQNIHKGGCSNKIIWHEGGVNTRAELNERDRSVFLKYLLEQAGDAPFVVGSDSQTFIEALENLLKAEGLEGYRLDSTTSNQDWVKEFLNGADGPKKFIEKHKPPYILYTPSAESGTNIDIKGYFENLFFYFCGVIHTNQQLQMIRRVRDSEPLIHVFCKPRGIPEAQVSNSPFPNEVEQAIRQYVVDCGYKALEGIDFKESLQDLITKIISLSADSHFEFECKLKAIANHERSNLRQCLREALIESGYQLISFSGFSQEKYIEKVRDAEENVKTYVSEMIHSSPDVTTEQADEITSRGFGLLDRSTKYKVLKRRLLDKLPGIEEAKYKIQEEGKEVEKSVFTPEFVKEMYFDNRHKLSKLETFFFLQNSEHAKQLQQHRWQKSLLDATGENPRPLKLGDYRSRYLKIAGLMEVGIIEFIEFTKQGNQWSSSSPEAIKVWQKAKEPRIARAIGRRVGSDNPASFVGKLLKDLGYKTRCDQVRKGKERVREYAVQATPISDPISEAAYEAIARRIEAQVRELVAPDWEVIVTLSTKSSESQRESNFQAVTPELDSLKNSARCDSSTEQAGAYLSESGWSEQAVADAIGAWGIDVVDDALCHCPIEVLQKRRNQIDEIRLAPPVDPIEAEANNLLVLAPEDAESEAWTGFVETVRAIACEFGERFFEAARKVLHGWRWEKIEPLLT